MQIGTTHRNKIWRSLVEFRNMTNMQENVSESKMADLEKNTSSASTASSK